MNILQLCNKVPYPAKDGGSIATFNLSRGFVACGHNVSLLAMNTSKHHCNIYEARKEISPIRLYGVDIDTRIKPIALFFNFFFSNKPYNAVRFESEAFKEVLISLLKKGPFDIVQLEGLYLESYIPTIKKYSNAKVALRAHNIEHEIWERTASIKKFGLQRFYLKSLAKRIKKLELNIINTYDLLVPITERDAASFKKFGNTKPCFVSPTGINISMDSVTPRDAFPDLFQIGALDWTPNQEGLLWFLDSSWPQILKNLPDIKFHIAGRNAPEWFINKLKEYKNIVFHGEVPRAGEFINNHYIMVVPLLSGSGMRIKIIEGMAHGKAIVATSIGAEGIPAVQNKDIIIANTSDAFVSEINNLATDFSKYTLVSKNAVNFIKSNFENTRISEQLIDFYAKNLST